MKDIFVFDIHKKLSADETDIFNSLNTPVAQDSFAVVFRSIGKLSHEAAGGVGTAAAAAVVEEGVGEPGSGSDAAFIASNTTLASKNSSFSSSSQYTIAQGSIPPSTSTSTSLGLSGPTNLTATTTPSSLPLEPPTSHVYLFGYLIEPSVKSPSNECTVTVVTHLSPDLSRLEAQIGWCRKLKHFVDEFFVLSSMASTLTSASPPRGEETGLRKRNVASQQGEANQQTGRLDRMKSLLNSTAGYIKSKASASTAVSWLNSKASSDTSLDGGNVSTGDDGTESILSSEKSEKGQGLVGTLTRRVMNNSSKISSFLGTSKLIPSSTLSDTGVSGGDDTDVPFSVGEGIADVEFREVALPGKESYKMKLSHEVTNPGESMELVWEFLIKGDQSLLFGIVFTSDAGSGLDSTTNENGTMENYLRLFPESSSSQGSHQVLPVATISTPQSRLHHGGICISSFPSGTFTLVWENQGSKKTVKDLSCRSVIRPFQLPVGSPLNVSDGAVGEFGLGASFGEGYHCVGVSGDVSIFRKSIYRVSVV
jgi:hypothetical protein